MSTGEVDCSSFFVEPVKWMEILLLGVTSGEFVMSVIRSIFTFSSIPILVFGFCNHRSHAE